MSTFQIMTLVWAIAATAMTILAGNSFRERAHEMNDLTAQLAVWEHEHNQCLGKEVDALYWLGGCPYGR